MKTLSPELLETIVARLVACLQPEKIILFGSHAYGEPNEDSDIDLLVIVGHSDEPSYRRSRRALRALRGIGIPKDIIVLTRQEVARKEGVPNSIAYQAIRQGRVLYG